MYARKLSIPEFKAWSQNLGHEGAMTSLTSYGKLSLEEQRQLIQKPTAKAKDDEDEVYRAAKEIVRRHQRKSGDQRTLVR
jgi:hypothetical protein